MTKFQTLAVLAAILLAPVSGLAGKAAADYTISLMRPDCNAQARAWINQFPANQPLATMPAFVCVK